jgi:hypothetical protein
MHGSILVESEIGKGTTLSLVILSKHITKPPLSHPKTDSGIPPEIPKPTPPASKPIVPKENSNTRVLVVEDNLLNQTLLAKVLKLKGIFQIFLGSRIHPLHN